VENEREKTNAKRLSVKQGKQMKNKTKKIILELLDFYPGTIIMPIIFIIIMLGAFGII